MSGYNGDYEIKKHETLMAKGLAIISMVLLHLFCRLDNLPYTPLLYVGEIPVVYYIGLSGDICVPIYCFCSGYAHYLIYEKENSRYYKKMCGRLFRFLLNFWIVVFVFSILGIVIEPNGGIPGSVSDFFGNIFLYRLSYNGAWWFVLTYVFFVVLSPVVIFIVQRLPLWIVLGSSFLYYLGAYVLRYNITIEMPYPIFEWMWTQFVLLGTSQIGYVFGMVMRKKRWMTRIQIQISKLQSNFKFSLDVILNIACFVIPLGLCVFHGLVQSVIIAPFTGIMTLICFFLYRKQKFTEKIFLFFGKHSTNMWLVHMFFYAYLFENLVFVMKYPVLVLGFMLILCVVSSSVINRIQLMIEKLLKKVLISQ